MFTDDIKAAARSYLHIWTTMLGLPGGGGLGFSARLPLWPEAIIPRQESSSQHFLGHLASKVV